MYCLLLLISCWKNKRYYNYNIILHNYTSKQYVHFMALLCPLLSFFNPSSTFSRLLRPIPTPNSLPFFLFVLYFYISFITILFCSAIFSLPFLNVWYANHHFIIHHFPVPHLLLSFLILSTPIFSLRFYTVSFSNYKY